MALNRDEKYGTICYMNEPFTSKRTISTTVCNELNFSPVEVEFELNTFVIPAKPPSSDHNLKPVIRILDCPNSRSRLKDCVHYGFGIVNNPSCSLLFIDCNTTSASPPFFDIGFITPSKIRVAVVKLQRSGCMEFCLKHGASLITLGETWDKTSKPEIVYRDTMMVIQEIEAKYSFNERYRVNNDINDLDDPLIKSHLAEGEPNEKRKLG